MMLRKKGRLVRWTLVGVFFIIAFVAGSTVASASHQFNDVPTSALYHDAVEWLANRLVTLGCAPSLFCPNNAVSRGQMALFMQRLGTALTPVTVYGTSGYTSLDIDLSPVVCQTAGYTTGDYPQQATITPQVSGTGAGALGFHIVPMVSTDGGSTWNFALGNSSNFHRASIGASGEWANAVMADNMALAANTTYNWGIEVGRVSGSTDFSDYRCDIMVVVDNRQGTSSPFSGEPAGSTDRNP